jgi:hypothetical protein
MDSWNQELERIENKSFRMYERLARAVEELQSILESLYGTDQAAVGEEPQQRQQLEELKRIAEAKQRECNSEQKEVSCSRLSSFVCQMYPLLGETIGICEPFQIQQECR